MTITRAVRSVCWMLACAVLRAEPSAAQAADPCEVLGRSIVSEERSFSIDAIRKSNLTYLCESSITSAEEATKLGWKVGFAIEGIPIEAIWSSDTTKREEARKAICSKVDTHTDRLTIRETVSRVPRKSIAALYSQCVAIQAASKGQIAAYFMPPADGANLTYQVYYAKDLAVPDPVITRADVLGANTAELRDGAGKSVVGKMLSPGVSTFPLTRTGNTEVRVILETNQKQKIPPVTAPPVPLDLEVRFDVYGKAVRDDGWAVYQLNDERNCGGDDLSYTRPWTLSTLERFPTSFSWEKNTTMGNCDGKSDVAGVHRNSESDATINYHMVGCGYTKVFNVCKGRGILRSTLTAPIEHLDPNSSRIWAEQKEDELEFVTGAASFALLETVQDHGRVSDIEWTVRLIYPVAKGGALIKRQLILNKNQRNNEDPDANLCFRARESTNGRVLVEVTDRRNYHCDDPALNYIDFLRETDPCQRADNGLPIPRAGQPASEAPVHCEPTGK